MSSRLRLALSLASATVMLAAGTASASQYKISGSAFTGSEAVSAKLLSTNMQLESQIGGVQIEIACTGVGSTGTQILGNSKSSVQKAIFTSCVLTKPAACKLTDSKGEITTTIETSPVAGEVQTAAESFFVRFAPKEGESFVTLRVGRCAVEGAYLIKGPARCQVQTALEEILKGCVFSGTSGSSMKWGVEPATIRGTVGATLSGSRKGLVWSVN